MKEMTKNTHVVLAMGALALAIHADAKDFQIGAYCLKSYAQTEQHIRDIRDCHVDFVVGIDYRSKKTFELFAKYGIKACVDGVFPVWWGGWKDKNGGLSTNVTPNVIAACAKSFRNFGTADIPSVAWVSVGDEPSALDYPYYHDYIAQVAALLPRQVAHLNIHPCYPDVEAEFGYIGAKDYAEYLKLYCENVPLDYISYDHYLYSRGKPGGMGPMLRNFMLVSEACRRTGRSFWFVPQVNTSTEKVEITEPKLRYQANVAMAFGAEALVWACWTEGWWKMNVIDTNGVKTVQYDRLRRVNAEIKAISPFFMRFRNVDTQLVGFGGHPSWLKGCPQTGSDAFSNGFVREMRAADGDALVVGDMVSRREGDSSRALYVVAAEDAWDENPKVRTVTFRTHMEAAAVGPGGRVPLNRSADGVLSFEVKSNEAVLVVLR